MNFIFRAHWISAATIAVCLFSLFASLPGTGLKMQTVRFFNVTLIGSARWESLGH